MQSSPEQDIEAYLADCVKIEPSAIEEEFVRIPADLAYWNNRYAAVYQHWLEMKLVRERTYYDLFKVHQTYLLENAKGRVTIAETEAAVYVDPDYTEAKAKEITAEAEKVRLYGVMDALRSKRDMLISIGAHMRAEMQHDPMIRDRRALESEVAKGKAGG